MTFGEGNDTWEITSAGRASSDVPMPKSIRGTFLGPRHCRIHRSHYDACTHQRETFFDTGHTTVHVIVSQKLPHGWSPLRGKVSIPACCAIGFRFAVVIICFVAQVISHTAAPGHSFQFAAFSTRFITDFPSLRKTRCRPLFEAVCTCLLYTSPSPRDRG